VRSPPDPEGLTSLDTGTESPAGPTVNEGPCLGWGWTTPGRSDADAGCGRGDALGDAGTTSECWLDRGFCTDESIDVGGTSCGGETWGVIIAGSADCFLWSSAPLVLSSREDVPAGVRGGECMADGEDGVVPMEERW
jgi:hypothetical protein